MTLRDVLLDPTIFKDATEFHPERWLPENPDLERISRAYLPFGRGSRMCLGVKYVHLLSSIVNSNTPTPRTRLT